MVKLNNYDLVIVGAGPSGLFLGKEAKKQGISVVIFDREKKFGGILNQCIHNGFGLTTYKKDLTGPELVDELKEEVLSLNIPIILNSFCLGFEDNSLYFLSPKGVIKVQGKYYTFSLGARERNRGSLFIEGDRPSGIFTAGFAQYLTNILGLKVGNRAIILGSGDIGLIMARRLKIEGVDVVGVFELMPFFGGLQRNIRQCLEDFDIPLYLSHTVVRVEGYGRLNRVYISKVNENQKPIGPIKEYNVDTLLLSVGLIPEVDIIRKILIIDKATNGPLVNQYFETNVENVFVVGNSLTIFDLVDSAMVSSLNILKRILNKKRVINETYIQKGNFIKNLIPQKLERDGTKVKIYFRVKKPLFNKSVVLREKNRVLKEVKKISIYPAQMDEIEIDTNLIEDEQLILEII